DKAFSRAQPRRHALHPSPRPPAGPPRSAVRRPHVPCRKGRRRTVRPSPPRAPARCGGHRERRVHRAKQRHLGAHALVLHHVRAAHPARALRPRVDERDYFGYLVCDCYRSRVGVDGLDATKRPGVQKLP
ncbi:hypothetical protein CERSUDRAFT_120231, partial [Gelatoporia subvermispora B]